MLEITVSPETERQLNDLATQNNESVKSLASKLFAEKVAETVKQNGNGNHRGNADEKCENPLMKFAGLISSKGDGKTSQNYKEKLRNEIDKRGGFGGS